MSAEHKRQLIMTDSQYDGKLFTELKTFREDFYQGKSYILGL